MIDYKEKYSEVTTTFLEKLFNNHSDENIVFSPVSIIELLLLAINSTNSDTRDEILNVISDNKTRDELNEIICELQKEFTYTEGFKSSNAVFVRSDMEDTIRSDYKEKIEGLCDTKLFASANLIDDLNKWVCEKTNGMIEDIATSDMQDMLVGLINAVIFDSKWETHYDEWDVHDGYFYNTPFSKQEVKMLTSTEKIYLEDANYIGFAKPYRNGYSFVGLLPKKKGEKHLENVVGKVDFYKLLTNLSYEEVFVSFPEFSVEFNENLNSICKELGIKTIFNDDAGFSEMASEDLMVESIIHKAKIEVNKAGTRASAVTCMLVVAGGADIKYREVILNRPFVYAIVNNSNYLPVFAGVVNKM